MEESLKYCNHCSNEIDDFENHMYCACDVECCDDCLKLNPDNDEDNARYCAYCVPGSGSEDYSDYSDEDTDNTVA